MNQLNNLKISKSRLIVYFSFALLLYFVYRYRIDIGSILKPFIISIIFAYLLNPIVQIFERHGIGRILSVIIVYLLFLVLIMVFMLILVPSLVKDIRIMIDYLPEYSDQLQSMILSFQNSYLNSNLPQSVKDVIDENFINLQELIISNLKSTLDSVLNAFSKLLNIILIPIIVFYLLKDVEYFKKQSILLLPKRHRDKAILLFRDIDNAFGKFIRGQIIIAFFVGVLSIITLYVINVKYAVFLGIFAGIANIIPYFGPIIGLIPTVIFALFDSPSKALYAAIAFIVIQQVESGILTPKIIGESVGLHPVYVILSLFIGARFMGVGGMILAVPILVAIKLTFRHLLRYIRHET